MNVGDKIEDASGTEYTVEQIYKSGGQGEAFRARRTSGDTTEPLVIKLYKSQESDRIQRLNKIISHGHSLCFGFPEKTFCFPTSIVQHRGREGVVMPHTPSSAKEMSELFEIPQESAHSPKAFNALKNGQIKYKTFLLNAFHLARAVDKLYRNGYTHCDLSISNVFIDASNGHTSIIDLDNLAVEGFLPTNVGGTPGYRATEIEEGRTTIPNHKTDAHSLAVLIFNLLMFRHPLVGSNLNVYFADDPFGKNALYTDHPTNKSNRFAKGGFSLSDLPKAIQDLFSGAFVSGLRDSIERPSATAWIKPLWNAIEALYICAKCQQTTFFTNTSSPECLFCRHRNQRPFAKLSFSNGFIKIVEAGSILYPHHFRGSNFVYDVSEKLADFKPHKGNDLLFANRSNHVLEVSFSRTATSRKVIPKDHGFRMSEAKKIYFLNGLSADVVFFN